MDKQVFIRNLDQVKRKKILLIRIGLSLLFVTLCASMWLSKTGLSAHSMQVFKGLTIAVFAGLVYAFITVIQRMCRRLELHCPACNRNLSGPLSHKVLESDQCFQCGVKLFR